MGRIVTAPTKQFSLGTAELTRFVCVFEDGNFVAAPRRCADSERTLRKRCVTYDASHATVSTVRGNSALSTPRQRR
jgi:hypothetical protein